MSEVLARIRVRETAGIRRFLYPLSTIIWLPEDADISSLSLQTPEGQSLPLLISLESGRNDAPYRLDFALSFEPLSITELSLTKTGSPALVNDPLQFEVQEDANCLRNTQKRLALDIGWDASISNVVYDEVELLRGPSSITRNGESMNRENFEDLHGTNLLAAWVKAEGNYNDEAYAETRIEITACKSWAGVSHWMLWPSAGDEFVFTLPLKVTAPVLTCDFGIGGGIYGKLQAGVASEIIWRTDFVGEPYAQWSVATDGRVDYIGEVASFPELLPQLWFHLIDSDKALAVAITSIDSQCKEMAISLNHTGDVKITFTLNEYTKDDALFSVCYHFLNDVPAIAAATNPQSILLPPIVEVWGRHGYGQ